MQKEKREMCQQKFKDFEAIKVAENEQILVMDWKNKNGFSEYSIRYMLDKEKGNLIITGDLGAGIASWYNSLYPEKLASFLNDIGYFKSKIQCWTETYTYRYKDIEEDLMSIKKDLILDGYDETELEVDFNKILSLSTYIDGGVGAYPDDLTEIFEKYDRDWQQSEFAYLGRRVSNRIYFWAVGFQMAVDDLLRKEQRKKIRYFEVSMKRKGGPDNEYSMCVLGIRKPTCKEAEKFFRADIKDLQYDQVSAVTEITKEEAYNGFDMEEEGTMPVFGK